MSGTFTLAWELDNGRRVVTDPIPHNADEATVNVAVADATRKDKRDMLHKLTKARRALTIAERGFTDARGVEADMYREEIDIARELNKAHDRTCCARVVTQDRAKAVRQAKEEARNIKNAIYSTVYGGSGRAPTTLANAKVAQRIAAEKYTAAWAAFSLVARGAERDKVNARAKAAGAKANYAEATKAVHAIQDEKVDKIPKDSCGCPRAVIMDDVVAAYAIVAEAVTVAERANETAVSAEAMAISAFNAHLAAKDKADKAAAKTYSITFAASHDIGAADTAANILFKKMCRADVGPAWETRQATKKDAIDYRTHATSMHDSATKLLEDARALRIRAHKESVEASQMATDALAESMHV